MVACDGRRRRYKVAAMTVITALRGVTAVVAREEEEKQMPLRGEEGEVVTDNEERKKFVVPRQKLELPMLEKKAGVIVGASSKKSVARRLAASPGGILALAMELRRNRHLAVEGR